MNKTLAIFLILLGLGVGMYIGAWYVPHPTKIALYGGHIPQNWSEYFNGFRFAPISDTNMFMNVELETYAKNVMESMSPYSIEFNALPSFRMDTFSITLGLKDKLIADSQKAGTYSQQTIGHTMFDVITAGKPSVEIPAGGFVRMYIHQFADASDGSADIALFLEYLGDKVFEQAIQRYLATIGFEES